MGDPGALQMNAGVIPMPFQGMPGFWKDLMEGLMQIIDAARCDNANVPYAPDDFLCGIVGSMATATEFKRAIALGIPDNTSLEDIILQYVEDFGEGQVACVQQG